MNQNHRNCTNVPLDRSPRDQNTKNCVDIDHAVAKLQWDKHKGREEGKIMYKKWDKGGIEEYLLMLREDGKFLYIIRWSNAIERSSI